MGNKDKKSILIIDDQKENIKILIELLRGVYTVYFSTDGVKGYELAKMKQPDLILLDIMMEPLNGYEVCKKLKRSLRTKEIPIIFLTGKTDSEAIKLGVESGGTDFIFKPFVPSLIIKRIENYLLFYEATIELKHFQKLEMDFNPLTLLPGGNTIKRHINLLIESGKQKTVFYIDIGDFRRYNEVYGISNGDKVLIRLCSILKIVADKMKIDDVFIGHLDEDMFFITLPNDRSEAYIKNVIKDFDELSCDFYNEIDYNQGFVKIKNRKGEVVKYPLISLRVSGIDLKKTNYSNYFQLRDACKDINEKLKESEGSHYLMDKRTHLI